MLASTKYTSVDPLNTALARALILPLSYDSVTTYRTAPERNVPPPPPSSYWHTLLNDSLLEHWKALIASLFSCPLLVKNNLSLSPVITALCTEHITPPTLPPSICLCLIRRKYCALDNVFLCVGFVSDSVSPSLPHPPTDLIPSLSLSPPSPPTDLIPSLSFSWLLSVWTPPPHLFLFCLSHGL